MAKEITITIFRPDEMPEEWKDGRPVDLYLGEERWPDMRWRNHPQVQGGGKWHNGKFREPGYRSCLMRHVLFVSLPPEINHPVIRD